MADHAARKFKEALFRIYHRPDRAVEWQEGGNLPWDRPDFARRMLREHLDESHGAATRPSYEREQQIDWLWEHLALKPGARVFDVTCGPGLYAAELARRGCQVTGVDFSPAAIAHARNLASELGVGDRCRFLQEDLYTLEPTSGPFEAAFFLYGQMAVFPPHEAARIVRDLAEQLVEGACLCVELLDSQKIDRTESNWWFTDDTGLWGDAPFLHLGERSWNEETQTSTERFYTLHLETGELDEATLCDQAYSLEEAKSLFLESGFRSVETFSAWDGLDIKDAQEWTIYLARK